jgi:hypothetical protein
LIVPEPVGRAIARGHATTIIAPLTPQRRYRTGDLVRITPTVWAELTRVRRAPLGHLTDQEAREAGYPSAEAFTESWVQEREAAWVQRQRDYLEKVGDRNPEAFLAQLLRSRYHAIHAHKFAWFLTAQPTEAPRLLAAASDEIYVQSPGRAMRGTADPGEALTEEEHKRHVQDRADRRAVKHAKQLEAERDKLAYPVRKELVRQAAVRRRVDISSELYTLNRMEREGRSEEALLVKLRAIEAIVRPEAA